jgi:hypothetical protein
MFYTNIRSPVKQIWVYAPAMGNYDRDFERAQQDRAGGNGLVSLAYWIVRGVQALFGLIRRR